MQFKILKITIIIQFFINLKMPDLVGLNSILLVFLITLLLGLRWPQIL